MHLTPLMHRSQDDSIFGGSIQMAKARKNQKTKSVAKKAAKSVIKGKAKAVAKSASTAKSKAKAAGKAKARSASTAKSKAKAAGKAKVKSASTAKSKAKAAGKAKASAKPQGKMPVPSGAKSKAKSAPAGGLPERRRGERLDQYFSPLADLVFVEVEPQTEKTAGGLFIPDTAGRPEGAKSGRVVACGPGARDKKGRLVPLEVRVGDRVMLTAWSGQTVTVLGQELTAVRETELLGVAAN
jgi:chaperonin GroES